MSDNGFTSFNDFYPDYLQEHSNRTCRRLHFAGTTLVIGLAVASVATGNWWMLWLLPVAGYGFAWLGHFGFEKNRPATFSHPLYSFVGDWVMFAAVLRGRLPF